jgi:DNA-binding transcriptional regulator YhcF (GntR family)
VSVTKYAQVAADIRARIADGTLLPGQPAPSGAALAHTTGYSVLTCRKALRILIRDGVLVPGPSRNARPRVPARTSSERTVADAARILSESLAAWRRAAGLTQVQLAKMVGVSVTSLGHAETGRLWQGRRFWERADKQLCAGGKLLALHDAYLAAAVPPDPDTSEETPDAAGQAEERTAEDITPAPAVAVAGPVICVMLKWADGTVTTVYPPETPARPANATSVAGRVGHLSL